MGADEAGAARDEGAAVGCLAGHGAILDGGCERGVGAPAPAARKEVGRRARRILSESEYGMVYALVSYPVLGPWLPVITLIAAGAAAAAGYALTAPKHYRATAQLIVSPVPVGRSTFTGIDVLRDSGGKRTAAASAAALVRAPLVADAVRALLGLAALAGLAAHALDAHVVDSSDVVAVTVEDTSASSAAQLANAFADTLVNERAARSRARSEPPSGGTRSSSPE